MVAQYLTCPFCGFEFEKDDTLCAHGCPLGALCALTRCPSCAHEFPETPRTVSWVQGLFKRGAASGVKHAESIRTLRDLKQGEVARVVCVGGPRASRPRALAVFGLEAGSEITLVQQRPSCVVQVGETVLALDSAIAREILVQPAAAAAGS